MLAQSILFLLSVLCTAVRAAPTSSLAKRSTASRGLLYAPGPGLSAFSGEISWSTNWATASSAGDVDLGSYVSQYWGTDSVRMLQQHKCTWYHCSILMINCAIRRWKLRSRFWQLSGSGLDRIQRARHVRSWEDFIDHSELTCLQHIGSMDIARSSPHRLGESLLTFGLPIFQTEYMLNFYFFRRSSISIIRSLLLVLPPLAIPPYHLKAAQALQPTMVSFPATPSPTTLKALNGCLLSWTSLVANIPLTFSTSTGTAVKKIQSRRTRR